MWQDTKAELDEIFGHGNKIRVERRRSNRFQEFTSHLAFLDSFAQVRSDIIRPAMSEFGEYVRDLGHMYFIETADELLDGYQFPTSRICLQFLMNVNIDPRQCASHSITFRTDNTRMICVYQKTGDYSAKNGIFATTSHAVGRYPLEGVTHALVETQLKDFIAQAILSWREANQKVA